ncbi:MAG: 5'-methylthioadenosine/S-adenosylhomocysteine nucleosidase [Lactobacillales bacterium]|jgi:adenosylhomocysteine nucleosidase|nr:5'-methylthioadenosine/S-adenosylhomocysteine nucleosidase [Lactobacillales bacterium]
MKIGVIGSVKEELENIRQALVQTQTIEIENFRFTSGELKHKKIVLAEVPNDTVDIEKVTELLIHTFQVGQVIATGLAGAIDDELSPLALVIGNSYFDCQTKEEFPAEDTLVQLFKKIYPSAKVGKILTVEQFIDDTHRKQELKKVCHAVAVDCESARVAEVCAKHATPFVSVRTITDNANNQAWKNFNNYEELAAEKSTDILLEALQKKI